MKHEAERGRDVPPKVYVKILVWTLAALLSLAVWIGVAAGIFILVFS